MTNEQINKAKKLIFMEHWVEENFALDEFQVTSPDEFTIILEDRYGSKMTVELRDDIVCANGKPMAAIPSLSF